MNLNCELECYVNLVPSYSLYRIRDTHTCNVRYYINVNELPSRLVWKYLFSEKKLAKIYEKHLLGTDKRLL